MNIFNTKDLNHFGMIKVYEQDCNSMCALSLKHIRVNGKCNAYTAFAAKFVCLEIHLTESFTLWSRF